MCDSPRFHHLRHPPSTKDCKLCCAQFFTAHANKNSKVNEMMVGDPVELPVDLVLAVNQHGLHVARQLEPTGPPVILTTSKVFCIPFESESLSAHVRISLTPLYMLHLPIIQMSTTSVERLNQMHRSRPLFSLSRVIIPSLLSILPPSLTHRLNSWVSRH